MDRDGVDRAVEWKAALALVHPHAGEAHALRFEVTREGVRLLEVLDGAMHRRATLRTSRDAIRARDDDLSRRIAQTTRCCALFSPVDRTYSEALTVALSARDNTKKDRVSTTRTDDILTNPSHTIFAKDERGGAVVSVLGS